MRHDAVVALDVDRLHGRHADDGESGVVPAYTAADVNAHDVAVKSLRCFQFSAGAVFYRVVVNHVYLREKCILVVATFAVNEAVINVARVFPLKLML